LCGTRASSGLGTNRTSSNVRYSLAIGRKPDMRGQPNSVGNYRNGHVIEETEPSDRYCPSYLFGVACIQAVDEPVAFKLVNKRRVRNVRFLEPSGRGIFSCEQLPQRLDSGK
jgi:hypothetical protein